MSTNHNLVENKLFKLVVAAYKGSDSRIKQLREFDPKKFRKKYKSTSTAKRIFKMRFNRFDVNKLKSWAANEKYIQDTFVLRKMEKETLLEVLSNLFFYTAKTARTAKRAYKKAPKNALRVAIKPKIGGKQKPVHAVPAAENGTLLAWGTTELDYKKGRDVIVTYDWDKKGSDQGVVRKKIFDTTYKPVRGKKDLYVKDPKAQFYFFVAKNWMRIIPLENYESGTENIVRPGDRVLIGTVGELWVPSPEYIEKKYKISKWSKF